MATKVSVFTPSHRPRWLDECYTSLVGQSFGNWEWIVVLNNGAEWDPPPDGRVRVWHAGNLKGVGAAKEKACRASHGEILVELDHDDILEPGALERIVDVFDTHPNVGFVYSDFAQVTEDGGRAEDRWDNGGDWQYYDTPGGLLAAVSFEPYPHNVSTMVFAPNHVRAFRRSAYDKAGGYDKERVIADDLDLMCRLYQITEFHHIHEPLYRQRLHAGMTQRDQPTNDAIQLESLKLYDLNIEANALIWAKREGLAALDLGGAHGLPEGYMPIDKAISGHDVVMDLAEYETSSVGVIRAVDFLEHVGHKILLMNEIYRVLAHGAMLLSVTPSTDGRGAWQDPTHVSFWNQNAFWYWTDRDFAQYVPEIKARFQLSRLVTYFPSDWHKAHDISYVAANLIAVKEGARMGGRLAI